MTIVVMSMLRVTNVVKRARSATLETIVAWSSTLETSHAADMRHAAILVSRYFCGYLDN